MTTIRLATRDDRAGWEALWCACCAHFRADLMTAEVVAGIWRRILDPQFPMQAWLALGDTGAVGLAHTILHPRTFSLRMVCTLEDLWVAPHARGQGAATALIGHLADVGRRSGWDRVQWETGLDNQRAARLYERLATPRPTRTYQIDLVSRP
ncbi:GNAT family N-acetyltransferase [Acuticoccus sediminis]|nr:GNAT family N-acetyltransferase [Acuticoccus sediminis]